MMFSGISNLMFTIVPVIVVIGFVFVFGTLIVQSIRGARQWSKNNHSPVLTVDARVISRRSDVRIRHHHHHDNMAMSHAISSTDYFVTFEVESGDRMEFLMAGTEYGQLMEGDEGKLTFQGTRYLGFERER